MTISAGQRRIHLGDRLRCDRRQHRNKSYGTVFAIEDGDSFRIRVVVRVHVDPEDEAGVLIGSKKALTVDNVYSSCGGDSGLVDVRDNKYSLDGDGFPVYVTIGNTVASDVQPGCDGTAIVEFRSRGSESPADVGSLQISIGVGSDRSSDGTLSAYLTGDVVNVDLTGSERSRRLGTGETRRSLGGRYSTGVIFRPMIPSRRNNGRIAFVPNDAEAPFTFSNL